MRTLLCGVDGKIYVIKQINIQGMTKVEQLDVVKEVQILASLDHACIVKYYDSFISEDRKLNIVMEYAARGTLSNVLLNQNRDTKQNEDGRKLPENTIWRYFIEILHGLNCMFVVSVFVLGKFCFGFIHFCIQCNTIQYNNAVCVLTLTR